MTNAFSLFRSLMIYGICLPLAIFVGYLLATPTDFTTLGMVSMLLMVMCVPLFLRWHYPLLVLCWNLVGGLYFLPGKPSFTLVMIVISFGFSMLAYIMNRNLKPISVPTVARPLLFITAVVMITARLNGGFGLNVLGSEAIGGKRYIYLLSGVIGYFALTAQKIPENKAKLYIILFFAGALTPIIGNLFYFVSPSFYFIFLLFPADFAGMVPGAIDAYSENITRLSGVCVTSVGALALMLALYGITGLLNPRKYWRLALVILFFITSMYGGFRSKVIEVMLMVAILFYLEGLMHSKILPMLILFGILLGAVTLPFTDKLPLSMQRSLSFLPLKLDMEAEMNAESSTEWRLEIWKNLLPTVPKYLLLGKGLSMDAHDLEMAREGITRGAETGAVAVMASDYHNGPLSLLIPFGLPGTFGFIWFLAASFRVLQRNNLYGDPTLATFNRFLLVYFLVRTIMFFVVVGSFYSELVIFVGPVGLSIALNGGVRSPVAQTIVRPVLNRFRLAGAAR